MGTKKKKSMSYKYIQVQKKGLRGIIPVLEGLQELLPVGPEGTYIILNLSDKKKWQENGTQRRQMSASYTEKHSK